MKTEAWKSGDWFILHVADGYQATVSLTREETFELTARLLDLLSQKDPQ